MTYAYALQPTIQNKTAIFNIEINKEFDFQTTKFLSRFSI